MRPAALAALVLILPGCGALSDPALDPLRTGQIVVFDRSDRDYLSCMADPIGGGLSVPIDLGTRAVVVADGPESGEKTRDVRVRIADGPNLNLVCTTMRMHLRPAP